MQELWCISFSDFHSHVLSNIIIIIRSYCIYQKIDGKKMRNTNLTMSPDGDRSVVLSVENPKLDLAGAGDWISLV